MTNRAIAKTKAVTIPNTNTSTGSEQQTSLSSILHLVTLALFYEGPTTEEPFQLEELCNGVFDFGKKKNDK